MNKIILTGTIAAGLAAAGLILAPNFANAMSGNGFGFDQSVTSRAEALNMTADQLRTQLETKTMLQVAEDQGLTEDQLHTALQTAAQTRWESRGLSQTEIDSRLASMKDRQANCDGDGTGARLGGGNGNGMHRSAE